MRFVETRKLARRAGVGLVGGLLVSSLALASASEPAAPSPLSLQFDYAAVDAFLRAARREPMDEAQWRALVADRGSREMVRNTIKYLPERSPDGYLASLKELARTGTIRSDPFQIGDAIADLDTIQTLIGEIRRDEPAIAARIVQRLAPHWVGQDPVAITIYLVVGGTSDGFVVDGDPAPQFFVAIDKAGGDLAGLEQNFTHESVHVLQRQLGIRHCPRRPSMEKLPPVERFFATIYEEGVANYLADPGKIDGEGDYIRMWRDRYRRNATPERTRENDWLYGVLLEGLRTGALTWETAYQVGFSGNLDSRMYFVGREVARRLDAAGSPPLRAGFVCEPEAFFRP